MRFVHAADLHVDSPLRGLERYEGAPVELAREATRTAVKNLVDLTLAEKADFLLIAGDLFDGDWKDFHTPLFLVNQLARLKERSVRAFIVLGNHDLQSELVPHVRWPENVTVFPSTQAGTCILQELGVAVHGRSYASAAITDDLAATYPPPIAGVFNVGMLHTNAAGASGGADHGTYAPCTVEELKARGYDYWALGHVHGHQVLSTTPHVVYPGNLQGRNVRETGTKGAVVVDVEGGKVTRLALAPCDVMRWARLEVAAEPDDLSFDLARKIARAIAVEAKNADGRVLAARIIVTGACVAHGELARVENGARFVADVRAATRDASEAAWVEKIVLKMSPLVDVASLRAAHDLVGDLLRSTHALAASGDLAKSLEPLFLPLRGKVGPALDDAGVRLDDPERLRRYVGDAETILIELLTGDDRG